MKITTLIEDSLSNNKDLIYEHGLSFFIQSPKFNILFDTGKSGNFIKNAKDMNIDLNKTNYIIISHAHYDHGNGLKSFTQNFNIRPQILLSKYFFSKGKKYYYNIKEKPRYIGVNFDEDFLKENSLNVQYINWDETEIEKDIYVFSNFSSHYDFEKFNPNMKIKINGGFEVDTFKDEICLGIDTPKGLLVLLGCSHPGILNMIKSIEIKSNKNIFGIIGGTHLMEASENRIEQTIVEFKKMNIEMLGPCHCTGATAYLKLKNSCSNFFVNATGSSISIP